MPLSRVSSSYSDEHVDDPSNDITQDLNTRSTSRLKFVKNQVNVRISGLHCTWLVPRTRASSDDVNGFLTLRVNPLEEGCSTLRAWPNRLAWDGQGSSKPLSFRPRVFGSNLPRGAYCREARRYPTQPQLT
ncbi:hypothetical protein M9H77_30331 [Catharanthus roseus]|uniref:Uncharacterized protein n=1 Tax=Catharanthus roseus TaxID=4058 RepID=A0ACB9ZZ03_CATRO|nr:hypothetical protein M9H77_30331 [Catharanthus roseus]